MSETATVTRIEPRWPLILAVVVVLSLLELLPSRVRIMPGWVPPLIGIVLIMPMLAVTLSSAKTRWLRVERVVILLFVGMATLSIMGQLAILLSEMVQRSGGVTGLRLLSSSISVWVTNVLVFSILYWQLDRGGPETRLNQRSKRPDWLFPQEGAPEAAPLNWCPKFIDYLFLSFCTATAFSPAEAQPMTSRGKLLMMIESLISLVTLAAVAARAINILGS